MNKLRRFLIRLAKPKNYVIAYIPNVQWRDDEMYGRKYINMGDGLRLYFEDGEFVGFSTQEPYIPFTDRREDPVPTTGD